jgi:hypothetical protein
VPVEPAADTKTEMAAQHRETCAVEESGPELAGSADHVTSSGLRTSMEIEAQQRLDDVTANTDGASPMSQGPKGVRTWLKTKFGRHISKSQKPESKNDGVMDDKAFIGGATLTGASSEPGNTSLEDVALAGKNLGQAEADEDRSGRSKRRASSVSSLSTPDTQNEFAPEASKELEFDEGSDHLKDPPKTCLVTKSSSPARDSRFHEVI